MKQIIYSGIGTDPNHVHTPERFVAVMKHSVENKKWQRTPDENMVNWIYENQIQLKFKDWILPDDFCFFTLEDWVEYSGARIEEI